MSRTGKILIVDDEPINIKLLACVLEPHYEVLFATNGRQAIALAETIRPDLILLDLIMPGMDGYEVCSALKQKRTLAKIPVIFVTARTEIANEPRWIEAGGVAYVLKPYILRDLLNQVRTHMRGHEARDRGLPVGN